MNKTQRLWTMMAAAAGMGLAPAAYGQCSAMMPRLAAELPSQAAEVPSAIGADRAADRSAGGSIIGLWQVTFTSGGQVVDQAFETFHSDGTELMIDTAPPASDNVCSGVWTQTDGGTVKLKHPSWTFDMAGNLNGTATIRLSVTPGPGGNRFSGTFTVDVYDLKGNPVLHLSGLASGVRITAD